MKKILITLLAAVMLIAALPLSAMAKDDSNNTGSYGYYYEHLTDPVAKRVYEAIENSRSRQNTSMPLQVRVRIPLPELDGYTASNYGPKWDVLQKQLDLGVKCYRYDFIKDTELYNDEYKLGLSSKADNRTGKLQDSKCEIILSAHPAYTPGMATLRDVKINRIAAEVNKQPTVFSKLRAIHDQITNMGTYNYDATKLTVEDGNKKAFLYAHSSLGILLEGTGVCESYAKIFKMVCDKLDLGECICLVSKTHMWNAISIDGKWYAVDVTWDDQQSGKEPVYTYFLSGDPDVVDGKETDHIVDAHYTVAPDYAAAAYRPADTTVTMPAPTTTVVNDTAGVIVTWNAVNRADKYLVYRATVEKGKAGEWSKLKTTANTTYTDKSTTNGVDYVYSVVAQNELYTTDHKASTIIRRLKNPAGALSNTTAGIKISWAKNSAAAGYRVYRATYSKGKWSGWTLLKTTGSTSYTDKKVKNGTDYKYAVRAYYGTSASDYTACHTIRRLASPKVTVTNAEKNIRVSWKKVGGASQYYVYRATYSKGKWSSWAKVATAKSTSYTDKKAKNGTQYRYKVRACHGSSTSADVTSASIKRLTATTAKVKKAASGIKVTWSKNKSAGGYYLYRRQYKNGKWSDWSKLGSTKKTSYTDKKAKKRVNYQYSVRAVSGSSISAIKASKKVKR